MGKEPSGLFTENFEPKESFFRIKALNREVTLMEWLGLQKKG